MSLLAPWNFGGIHLGNWEARFLQQVYLPCQSHPLLTWTRKPFSMQFPSQIIHNRHMLLKCHAPCYITLKALVWCFSIQRVTNCEERDQCKCCIVFWDIPTYKLSICNYVVHLFVITGEKRWVFDNYRNIENCTGKFKRKRGKGGLLENIALFIDVGEIDTQALLSPRSGDLKHPCGWINSWSDRGHIWNCFKVGNEILWLVAKRPSINCSSTSL